MGKKKRPDRGRDGLSAERIYTPGGVLSPRLTPLRGDLEEQVLLTGKE
jgi:hypothetical protein